MKGEEPGSFGRGGDYANFNLNFMLFVRAIYRIRIKRLEDVSQDTAERSARILIESGPSFEIFRDRRRDFKRNSGTTKGTRIIRKGKRASSWRGHWAWRASREAAGARPAPACLPRQPTAHGWLMKPHSILTN
ncbi:unnamed protein product [Colias eurytheme]|nr:unnamed protein product [Colias eurytheme]